MSGPSFEGTTRDAAGSGSEFAVAASDNTWPQAARDDSSNVAEEVARLEALLAERARALQDQKAQLQHAQQLLRGAAINFERTQALGPDPVALTRQRDAAVARAIEAEASRTELSFRLDELLGHRTEVGLSSPASDNSAVSESEPPDATVAGLEGSVRGLSSLLSETTEARDIADARLVLAEQDLAILRGRAHALQREIAEAREQIEFEVLRARGLSQQLEGTLSARQVAELRGELAGAGARRDEGETVAVALLAELETARTAERAARGESEQAASQILALKHGLEQETETAREATDKLASALAECVVLRTQVAQARNEAQPAPQPEVDHGAAQRGVLEQRGRADRMRDALREARHLLGELAGSLERTVKTMPPVAKAPHDDDDGTSEQPTQPGMPTYIEAMEGLEELVALRDEHIRDLTTKLQLERDRTRAIERGLQALQNAQSGQGASPGGLPSVQLSDLLALVQSR